MPLQATSGAASYDAFGGGVPFEPIYIESIFQTWLYTGNGSTQTITNGIDLAGEGGLVWTKARSSARNNALVDTVRGGGSWLNSNDTTAAGTGTYLSFNSNGYLLNNSFTNWNASATTYASWTFRKQPKFFDVVTWTGDGTNNRQISHALGSVPGCVITKRLNAVTDWSVWHRASGAGFSAAALNTTGTFGNSGYGPATAFTDTYFTVANQAETNASGGTYVAYLFAHDAGGFGLTGTDNVISCGSYTGTAGVTTVNVGFEPQWLLIKKTNATAAWKIVDNMRGFTAGPESTGIYSSVLNPNTSDAEAANSTLYTTSTGFNVGNYSSEGGAGNTFIYIAIRRGPMKVPTTGTSVFGLNARTGTSANATVTGSAGVTDLAIIKRRNSSTNWVWTPRLTGTGYLSSNLSGGEVAAGTTILQANPWDVMDGVKVGTTSNLTNESSGTFINYLIDRAPGFMDVSCYTGNGVAGRTVPHNLAVVPELIIVKRRNTSANWLVYCSGLTSAAYSLVLNSPADEDLDSAMWNSTNPTSSVFTVGTSLSTNGNNSTYVSYLFASCPGVSKVGSYTGTGTTQVINCGFTAGSRFVMIKRTNNTGNWFVWDSARGIVAGNDPYLLLNLDNAEVTNTDFIDTASTGFEISSTAPSAINASGGTFIFLAIS
jgi:hypothetical protein